MNTKTEIEKVVTELTERIVILYANYSGRESDNRGAFRKEVYDILFTALTEAEERGYANGYADGIRVWL